MTMGNDRCSGTTGGCRTTRTFETTCCFTSTFTATRDGAWARRTRPAGLASSRSCFSPGKKRRRPGVKWKWWVSQLRPITKAPKKHDEHEEGLCTQNLRALRTLRDFVMSRKRICAPQTRLDLGA